VLTLAEKLVQKKVSFKRTNDFLSYLFTITHQRLLKHYDENAGFGQLLTDNKYNCLTATALYALLLEHVGIDYNVIETNYHIFLLIQTNQGQVMFETTDAANGFVSDSKEIDSRIVQYREQSIQPIALNKAHYRYKVDLYKEVNLDEMLGLLHYNLSINAYNQHNLPMAIEQLALAVKLYHSPRMEEYTRVILYTVTESDFSNKVKESYLRSIQSLRESQLDITASTR
jgi:hypothetical protein